MKRLGGAALAALYFLSNVLFLHAHESSLWAERRALRARKQAADTRLAAALPEGVDGSNPAELLRQFPALNKTIDGMTRPSADSVLSKLPPAVAPFIETISRNVGTVKDVFIHPAPGKPAPFVVILQDVHLNSEAQLNIAMMLSAMNDEAASSTAGPLLVGVEGVFGAFDFSRFRAFDDKQITRDVADFFLTENKMAAPSYAGITAATPATRFFGIDDREHYDANVESYRAAQRVKKNALDAVSKEKRSLVERKKAVLNPSLQAFDARRSAYAAGAVGLGAYVSYLSKTAVSDEVNAEELVLEQFRAAYELERTLDFAQVERERTRVVARLADKLSAEETKRLILLSVAYRMGRISYAGYYKEIKRLLDGHGLSLSTTPAFEKYIRYVLLADGIKADALIAAVQRLEDRIMSALCKTEEEKNLMARSRRLAVVEKLLEFGLTPEEWDEYQYTRRGRPPRPPRITAARARWAGAEARPYDLSAFESFYKEADRRSRKMVDNLEAQLSASASSNRRDVAVIVAGGFHTPRLSALLKEKSFSYAVVQPAITKLDGASGTEYLSIFTREKTPLDRLFEGEKLFLAPPDVAPGASNAANRPISNLVADSEAVAAAERGEIIPGAAGVTVTPAGREYDLTNADGSHVAGKIGADENPGPEAVWGGTRDVRILFRPKISWVPSTLAAARTLERGREFFAWLINSFKHLPGRFSGRAPVVIPPAVEPEHPRLSFFNTPPELLGLLSDVGRVRLQTAPIIMAADTVIHIDAGERFFRVHRAESVDGTQTRGEQFEISLRNAVNPSVAEKTILVGPGVWTLGRSPKADLQAVPEDLRSSLSRFHVAVEISQDGKITVRDLISRNGTSVSVDNYTQGRKLKVLEIPPRSNTSRTPRREARSGDTMASRTPPFGPVETEPEGGTFIRRGSLDPSVGETRTNPLPGSLATGAPRLEQREQQLANLEERAVEASVDQAPRPFTGHPESKTFSFQRDYVGILIRKFRGEHSTVRRRRVWERDPLKENPLLLETIEDILESLEIMASRTRKASTLNRRLPPDNISVNSEEFEYIGARDFDSGAFKRITYVYQMRRPEYADYALVIDTKASKLKALKIERKLPDGRYQLYRFRSIDGGVSLEGADKVVAHFYPGTDQISVEALVGGTVRFTPVFLSETAAGHSPAVTLPAGGADISDTGIFDVSNENVNPPAQIAPEPAVPDALIQLTFALAYELLKFAFPTPQRAKAFFNDHFRNGRLERTRTNQIFIGAGFGLLFLVTWLTPLLLGILWWFHTITPSIPLGLTLMLLSGPLAQMAVHFVWNLGMIIGGAVASFVAGRRIVLPVLTADGQEEFISSLSEPERRFIMAVVWTLEGREGAADDLLSRRANDAGIQRQQEFERTDFSQILDRYVLYQNWLRSSIGEIEQGLVRRHDTPYRLALKELRERSDGLRKFHGKAKDSRSEMKPSGYSEFEERFMTAYVQHRRLAIQIEANPGHAFRGNPAFWVALMDPPLALNFDETIVEEFIRLKPDNKRFDLDIDLLNRNLKEAAPALYFWYFKARILEPLVEMRAPRRAGAAPQAPRQPAPEAPAAPMSAREFREWIRKQTPAAGQPDVRAEIMKLVQSLPEMTTKKVNTNRKLERMEEELTDENVDAFLELLSDESKAQAVLKTFLEKARRMIEPAIFNKYFDELQNTTVQLPTAALLVSLMVATIEHYGRHRLNYYREPRRFARLLKASDELIAEMLRINRAKNSGTLSDSRGRADSLISFVDDSFRAEQRLRTYRRDEIHDSLTAGYVRDRIRRGIDQRNGVLDLNVSAQASAAGVAVTVGLKTPAETAPGYHADRYEKILFGVSKALELLFNGDAKKRSLIWEETSVVPIRVAYGYHNFRWVSLETLLGDRVLSQDARDYFLANPKKLQWYIDEDLVGDVIKQLGGKDGFSSVDIVNYIGAYLEAAHQFETTDSLPALDRALDTLANTYKFSRAVDVGRVKLRTDAGWVLDEEDAIAELDPKAGFVAVPLRNVEEFKDFVDREIAADKANRKKFYIFRDLVELDGRLWMIAIRNGRIELHYASATYTEISGIPRFQREEAGLGGIDENGLFHPSWYVKPDLENAHEWSSKASRAVSALLSNGDLVINRNRPDAAAFVSNAHVSLGLAFDPRGVAISRGPDGRLRYGNPMGLRIDFTRYGTWIMMAFRVAARFGLNVNQEIIDEVQRARPPPGGDLPYVDQGVKLRALNGTNLGLAALAGEQTIYSGRAWFKKWLYINNPPDALIQLTFALGYEVLKFAFPTPQRAKAFFNDHFRNGRLERTRTNQIFIGAGFGLLFLVTWLTPVVLGLLWWLQVLTPTPPLAKMLIVVSGPLAQMAVHFVWNLGMIIGGAVASFVAGRRIVLPMLTAGDVRPDEPAIDLANGAETAIPMGNDTRVWVGVPENGGEALLLRRLENPTTDKGRRALEILPLNGAVLAGNQSSILQATKNIKAGREPGLGLQIASAKASRKHFIVEWGLDGRLVVRDLNSRNKTRVQIFRRGSLIAVARQSLEASIAGGESMSLASIRGRPMSADFSDELAAIGRYEFPRDHPDYGVFLGLYGQLQLLVVRWNDPNDPQFGRTSARGAAIAAVLARMFAEAREMYVRARNDIASRPLPSSIELGSEMGYIGARLDGERPTYLFRMNGLRVYVLSVSVDDSGALLSADLETIKNGAFGRLALREAVNGSINLAEAQDIRLDFRNGRMALTLFPVEGQPRALSFDPTERSGDEGPSVRPATAEAEVAEEVSISESMSFTGFSRRRGGNRFVDLQREAAIAEIERLAEITDFIPIYTLTLTDAAERIGRVGKMVAMRERDASKALDEGKIKAVKGKGHTYLVWVEGRRPVIEAAAEVDLEAPYLVSQDFSVDDVGAVSVRPRIQDRLEQELLEIARNPAPDTTAQQNWILRRLREENRRGLIPDRNVRSLSRRLMTFLSERTAMAWSNDELQLWVDSGSGETVMGQSIKRMTGGIIDPNASFGRQKQEIVYRIYRDWCATYRIPEKEGSKKARRESARERFKRKITDRVGINLAGSKQASPAMIDVVVNLLSRLPLEKLNESSDLVQRLRGGIDLSASRDQATRLGHYIEESGELGVQPTIFQLREFIEVFLHEFGHAAESRHVGAERTSDELVRLFRRARSKGVYAIPAMGATGEQRRTYISSDTELFAETFMHFILHRDLMEKGFEGYLPAAASQSEAADIWKKIFDYYRDHVFDNVPLPAGARRVPPAPASAPAPVTAHAPATSAAPATVLAAPSRSWFLRGVAILGRLPTRLFGLMTGQPKPPAAPTPPVVAPRYVETPAIDDTFGDELLNRAIAANADVAGYESTVGDSHLEEGKPNQDAAAYLPLANGVVLAGALDGMGGSVNAERASRVTREILLRDLSSLTRDETPEVIQQRLVSASIAVRQQLIKEFYRFGLTEGDVPGTTFTFSVIVPKKNGKSTAYILQSGDTRAYVVRKRILKPVTVDNLLPDTNERPFVVDETRARAILNNPAISAQKFLSTVDSEDALARATDDERKAFKERNVASNPMVAHPDEPYKPVIFRVELEEDDQLLFVSDGISDNLVDARIEELVNEGGSPHEVAARLVAAARAHARARVNGQRLFRGKDDDMTAVVVCAGASVNGLSLSPRERDSLADATARLREVRSAIVDSDDARARSLLDDVRRRFRVAVVRMDNMDVSALAEQIMRIETRVAQHERARREPHFGDRFVDGKNVERLIVSERETVLVAVRITKNIEEFEILGRQAVTEGIANDQLTRLPGNHERDILAFKAQRTLRDARALGFRAKDINAQSVSTLVARTNEEREKFIEALREKLGRPSTPAAPSVPNVALELIVCRKLLAARAQAGNKEATQNLKQVDLLLFGYLEQADVVRQYMVDGEEIIFVDHAWSGNANGRDVQRRVNHHTAATISEALDIGQHLYIRGITGNGIDALSAEQTLIDGRAWFKKWLRIDASDALIQLTYAIVFEILKFAFLFLGRARTEAFFNDHFKEGRLAKTRGNQIWLGAGFILLVLVTWVTPAVLGVLWGLQVIEPSSPLAKILILVSGVLSQMAVHFVWNLTMILTGGPVLTADGGTDTEIISVKTLNGAAVGAAEEKGRRETPIEDRTLIDVFPSGAILALIVDGAGGLGDQGDGRLASAAALESIRSSMGNLTGDESQEEMTRRLTEAMPEAERAIFEAFQKAGSSDGGASVTVVVVMPSKKGRSGVFIAQAGDTRAYVRERQGIFSLTTDGEEPPPSDPRALRRHEAEMESLRRVQRILSNLQGPPALNSEEERLFGKRNQVANGLYVGGKEGRNATRVHHRAVVHYDELLDGDRLILVSDGVHGNLIDNEIQSIVDENPRADAAARALATEAVLRWRPANGREVVSPSGRPITRDDAAALVIIIGKAVVPQRHPLFEDPAAYRDAFARVDALFAETDSTMVEQTAAASEKLAMAEKILGGIFQANVGASTLIEVIRRRRAGSALFERIQIELARQKSRRWSMDLARRTPDYVPPEGARLLAPDGSVRVVVDAGSLVNGDMIVVLVKRRDGPDRLQFLSRKQVREKLIAGDYYSFGTAESIDDIRRTLGLAVRMGYSWDRLDVTQLMAGQRNIREWLEPLESLRDLFTLLDGKIDSSYGRDFRRLDLGLKVASWIEGADKARIKAELETVRPQGRRMSDIADRIQELKYAAGKLRSFLAERYLRAGVLEITEATAIRPVRQFFVVLPSGDRQKFSTLSDALAGAQSFYEARVQESAGALLLKTTFARAIGWANLLNRFLARLGSKKRLSLSPLFVALFGGIRELPYSQTIVPFFLSHPRRTTAESIKVAMGVGAIAFAMAAAAATVYFFFPALTPWGWAAKLAFWVAAANAVTHVSLDMIGGRRRQINEMIHQLSPQTVNLLVGNRTAPNDPYARAANDLAGDLRRGRPLDEVLPMIELLLKKKPSDVRPLDDIYAASAQTSDVLDVDMFPGDTLAAVRRDIDGRVTTLLAGSNLVCVVKTQSIADAVNNFYAIGDVKVWAVVNDGRLDLSPENLQAHFGRAWSHAKVFATSSARMRLSQEGFASLERLSAYEKAHDRSLELYLILENSRLAVSVQLEELVKLGGAAERLVEVGA